MTAPAAPLEKAVAQGRAAMARWDKPEPVPVLRHSDAVDCVLALRSLLAALDADKGEAETLVRAIVSERHRCFIPTNIPEAPALMDWDERARRYFARRDKLEVPE